MAQETRLSVTKRITVRCAIDRAFTVFTDGIDAWWPKPSHSVSKDDCVAVAIEPGIGGRVYEQVRDGTTSEWGRITAWEPPNRLAFTWHPGRDASTAGDVEVRFTATDEGTVVTLEHTGFEKLGADAEAVCRNYDTGWAYVFGQCYGEQPALDGAKRVR